MTTNFLREPAYGQVAHSSTSAAFVRNTSLGDWALFMTSTSAMMASHTVEATERYGATDSKTQTTYNVWKNTDKPFFDHIKQDKELTRQFASYMKNVTSGKGTSIQHLLTGYDWDSLGEVTVVDVCWIPFPMLREKTCVLTRSCDASSLADPMATPALPSPKHSPISSSSCRTFPTRSKALAQSRKPSHHPSPAASDTSTTTSSLRNPWKTLTSSSSAWSSTTGQPPRLRKSSATWSIAWSQAASWSSWIPCYRGPDRCRRSRRRRWGWGICRWCRCIIARRGSWMSGLRCSRRVGTGGWGCKMWCSRLGAWCPCWKWSGKTRWGAMVVVATVMRMAIWTTIKPTVRCHWLQPCRGQLPLDDLLSHVITDTLIGSDVAILDRSYFIIYSRSSLPLNVRFPAECRVGIGEKTKPWYIYILCDSCHDTFAIRRKAYISHPTPSHLTDGNHVRNTRSLHYNKPPRVTHTNETSLATMKNPIHSIQCKLGTRAPLSPSLSPSRFLPSNQSITLVSR